MSEESKTPLITGTVLGFVVILLAGAILRSIAGSGGEPTLAATKLESCLPPIKLVDDSTISLPSLLQLGKLSGTDGQIGYTANSTIAAKPVKPGDTTLLLVGEGTFLLSGPAIFRSGSHNLLVQPGPNGLSLLPVPGQSYRIVPKPDQQLEIAGDVVTLPATTTGHVEPGEAAQTFRLGKEVDARAFVADAQPELFPQLRFSSSGPPRLPVEFDTEQDIAVLEACAIINGTAHEVVVFSDQDKAKSAELLLAEDLLPKGFTSWSTVRFVVAKTDDGTIVAIGSALVVWRFAAALIATAVAFVLIWGLLALRYHRSFAEPGPDGKLRPRNWSLFFAGLFVSEDDGEPSLSLFQVFFWTAITVWALLYTFIVTGSLIGMTQEMMVLLGIAGAGTVAARWIAAARGDYNVPPTGPGVDTTKTVAFWDILSTKGRFDLLKLQLLVFTLLIGLYVVGVIAQSGAFPKLDPDLLLLMGVSQGLYIGGKVASSSDLDTAQKLRDDYQTTVDTIAAKTAEVAALKAAANAADANRIVALEVEIATLTKASAELKAKFDAAVAKLKIAPV